MTAGECRAGGFLCTAGHELRLTSRCLLENLARAVDTPFVDLLEIPIVSALVGKRGGATIGSKTVGPAAGDRTLYHLGQGNDHRGATWFDAENGVVWLCAYRHHRSGTQADAFPYFRELIADGRMMPVRSDYEQLAADRTARSAREAIRDAQPILAKARRRPGNEVRGTVSFESVGVVVEVIETMTETYVALSMLRITPKILQLVLLGFYPDRDYDEWQPGRPYPARRLDADRAEMCFSIFHESA